jgi:copper oxidase (laccase) domain-containing protein
VAGAIERGIEAVGTPLAAWVGPSIRSCCYEVGPDVVSAFEERNLPVADSWHVDPGSAAFIVLKRAGIENVASASDCTSCDGRYFSHRRDRKSGRQGALIARL